MISLAYTKDPAHSETAGRGIPPDAAGLAAISGGSFALRRLQYFNTNGEANEIGPFGEPEYESLLSADQRERLIALLGHIDIDLDAQQQMLLHNLRLVVHLAKRHTNRGLTLLELVKAGNQGLIHALEKFDLEGGFRFSKYATQCISQYIERAIVDRSSVSTLARAPRSNVSYLTSAYCLNSGGCNGCLA